MRHTAPYGIGHSISYNHDFIIAAKSNITSRFVLCLRLSPSAAAATPCDAQVFNEKEDKHLPGIENVFLFSSLSWKVWLIGVLVIC